MKRIISSILASTMILSTIGTSFAQENRSSTPETQNGEVLEQVETATLSTAYEIFVDDQGNSYFLANGEKAFASKVVDFQKGDPWTSKDYCKDPQSILGPADGNYEGNILNLGKHGSIILEFDVWFTDGDGADIWVFEVGQEVEATTVEVSANGTDWIMIGECRGATSALDMSGKVDPDMYFKYVRVTDVDGSPSNYPGADIDAVAVIHNVITPPSADDNIIVSPIFGGTVVTSTTKAEAGERILLTATAYEDYILEKINVMDQNGNSITLGYDWTEECYAFIMPDTAVSVTANFLQQDETRYNIEKIPSEGGDFTLDNENPREGDEVTITTKPNSDYSVSFVTVTNKTTGERVPCINMGGGIYVYKQPSSSVSIKVTFQNTKNTTESYTDVSNEDWYAAYVAYVTENGYMNGTGDGFFGSDSPTTRGMVALILALASGDELIAPSSQEFPDVPLGQWYTNGVAWCKANGIVSGYENGNFGVDDPITKEQMVLMMQGFAKHQGKNVENVNSELLLGYADGHTVAFWAENAYAWALTEEYLQLSGNILEPQSNATRAEFANILNLFLEND